MPLSSNTLLLHERESDGVTVEMYAEIHSRHSADITLLIHEADGTGFALRTRNGAEALEMFYHPYLYDNRPYSVRAVA